MGAAVQPLLLDVDGMAAEGTADPYTQLVAAQCNILVAENAMKWKALRPTPDTWDFAPADRMIRFADLMGQRVRGHNLCWHEALPDWLPTRITKQNARQFLIDHIQNVAGHFRHKLQSWDVVNEAVDPGSGRPDGLRSSIWIDLVGPEYIELAFLTAAQADPTAKLVYNDYGIELDTPDQTVKRGQVLLLLRRLKARGIPIHAVGVQSHLLASGPQPGEGLKAFIREVARMDLEVYITEMDVKTVEPFSTIEEQDAAVAKVYQDYLTMVLAEPNVPMTLVWGVVNNQSWLNKRNSNLTQRPLLFDDAYNPTPAFYAARAAFDRGHIALARPEAPPASSPSPAPGVPANDPSLFKPFPVEGSPTAKPSGSGPQL